MYTGEQAVKRLRQFVGQGYYGLGAGGKNGAAETPFEYQSIWDYGSKYRADCIAAVLWAHGQSRFDKAFPEYGGWINVDSALLDAGCVIGHAGKKLYFKELGRNEKATVGDILMFPSVRAGEVEDTALPATERIRIGHTGLISGPGDGQDISTMTVIECSASPRRPAIKEHMASAFYNQDNRQRVHWKGKNFKMSKWRTRIVRYTKCVSTK